MTVSANVFAGIEGALTSARDGGDAVQPFNEGLSKLFTDGTGAGQANGVYIDDFSIEASGTLSIDLSGSLEDAHGNALVFTAIKAILLIADAANTNNVILGNVANGFVGPFGAATESLTVPPGGCVLLSNPSAAGWAVTAGTVDLIKLANSSSGSAVGGTIVILGEV
ncbi:hypothetical protein BSL82_05695 [Tardibacter chloracetimidivorans]|uniref:Uncharacterized protein n=1 Tax=Tardibacter chloracetimidivorans TaxID=1921510 RepID=A0A1L3ZT96_9SPHN|nr:hypothetical protein [Tardibacter chloracetimidivorans]API58866.1 hypothetical protein BSL82_05695 [Tardibacter chloracetimidivorans]